MPFFNRNDPKDHSKISIWGPSEAGKTSFLAGLYLEMIKHGWTATTLPNAEDTLTSYRNMTEDLAHNIVTKLDDGDFPAPTSGDGREYRIKFSRAREKWPFPDEFELAFLDLPGQVILDEDNRSDAYKAYLRFSRGILMIIDPDKTHKPQPGGFQQSHYRKTLQILYEHFQENSKDIRKPEIPYLAFCVTKLDQYENWVYKDNPEAFFSDIIGESAHSYVQNHFQDSYKVFSVSVVGRYTPPNYPEQDFPNIIYQPERNTFRIAFPAKRVPINLLSPLDWLLNKIGITKRSLE